MIGSLVNQILRQKGGISDTTRALYDKHNRSGTKAELKVVTSLFKHELDPNTAAFVVIDALDECPERKGRRNKLLDQIEKFPDNVRILITSRYSQGIEERFKDVAHIEIEQLMRTLVCRGSCPAGKVLGEVRSFQDGLDGQITETVIESSQGMFLLAQLHLDNLAKQLTVRAVQKALLSLPKEIDETYDQAMQRIQSQDEDQAVLAHKALHWIAYSRRPLTVDELKHALAVGQVTRT